MIILSSDYDDTNIIYGTLWQGSRPPVGETVRDQGFDALVLCDDRFQPTKEKFPGVDVLHAPYRDDVNNGLLTAEQELVWRTARKVARRLAKGMRVLVTCQAGLNRSGVVVALALHLHTGASGAACVRWVQEHRNNALFNPKFAEYLRRIPGKSYEELAEMGRSALVYVDGSVHRA